MLCRNICNGRVSRVPVAAEPGHGGAGDYYKNYYGYNGVSRPSLQVASEDKPNRRLVGFILLFYSTDNFVLILSLFALFNILFHFLVPFSNVMSNLIAL